MKLGLITDIHNDAVRLRLALKALRAAKVDQIITIGDTFDPVAEQDGIAEAIELLVEHEVTGVWGNHDYRFCRAILKSFRRRYPEAMFEYLKTFKPRLVIERMLFSHREGYVNPYDVAELWDYNSEHLDYLARSQRALADQRYFRQFVGHYHQWLAFDSSGQLDWQGTEPLKLSPDRHYFIVVAAVCDGWCATFDTEKQLLVPICLDSLGY